MAERSLEGWTTWLWWTLLAIAVSVFTYFYLLLHIGLNVPSSMLFGPASYLAMSVALLAAGVYFGRKRRDPRLLFAGFGIHCAVFFVEAVYFAASLGYIRPERARGWYGGGLCILAVDMVVAYYGYKLIFATPSGTSPQS